MLAFYKNKYFFLYLFSATVGNLQAKIESLTTTNALMKEDLAIARNSVLAVTAENQALRQNLTSGLSIQTDSHSNDRASIDVLEALSAEKRKNVELEKEIRLQVSLKAETDMAMKLLEKDIHEKQDTIISLRRQLDDIKGINLEMYKKLQVSFGTGYNNKGCELKHTLLHIYQAMTLKFIIVSFLRKWGDFRAVWYRHFCDFTVVVVHSTLRQI